jgi:catechol 2,3-dioxygenase-like lactoylglutathione lyase family enzyme
MNIKFESSVIFVQDIAVSREFYENLLEQKVQVNHGVNIGLVAGFALWQVDHACEVIYGHKPENTTRLGRQNYEMYFEAADVDAALARLTEAGVDFVHPLVEQPWGQRVFRVYDPDGHIVEIAEPMDAVLVRFSDEGLSVETIAERTAMPLELVEQIIRGGRR